MRSVESRLLEVVAREVLVLLELYGELKFFGLVFGLDLSLVLFEDVLSDEDELILLVGLVKKPPQVFLPLHAVKLVFLAHTLERQL